MHSRFDRSARSDFRPPTRPHAPAARAATQPACRDIRHFAARDYRRLLVSSAFEAATHALPLRTDAEHSADHLGRTLVRRCLQRPWVQGHAADLASTPPVNCDDWRRACVYAAAGAQALRELDTRASGRGATLAESCRKMRRPDSDPNLGSVERDNLDAAYDLIEKFGRNKLKTTTLSVWLNIKAIVVALHVGGPEAVRRCVLLLPARGELSLDAASLPTSAPDQAPAERAVAARSYDRYTPTQVQRLADGRRVWQPEVTPRHSVASNTLLAPPFAEQAPAPVQPRTLAPLPQRARLEATPAAPAVAQQTVVDEQEPAVARKHPRGATTFDDAHESATKRQRLPRARDRAVTDETTPDQLAPAPAPRGLFAWALELVSYVKAGVFGA